MDTTTLTAILQAEHADALGGPMSTELANERARAMDYYNGDMDEDMPRPGPDRSGAVSTDVADVVDGLMPYLMEVFASGDEVVRFEPVGPEDEDGAQQETDYVNHVFSQNNRGFLVLHDFLKDALLQKMGVVKVWWDTSEKRERDTFVDLSDDEFAVLLSADDIEVVEHETRPADPAPGAADAGMVPEGMEPPAPPLLHTVTVLRRKKHGGVKVVGVPPEEFGISRRARSLEAAPYCFHRRRIPISDLVADGYDRDQFDAIPSYGEAEASEERARRTDEQDFSPGAVVNEAMREIDVTEHYVRVDWDEDGFAELRRVVTAGTIGTILLRDGEEDNREIDRLPFAVMSPIIVPHRVIGRSVAELVQDIQRIKTALMRAMLDNVYFANNQRMAVQESAIGENTLDDLLTNRPNGIVRLKSIDGIRPIPNQPLATWVQPVMEYTDSVREWRTGVTRQGVGIDANALQNQTATAAVQAFNASQARMRMIARVLAETGIKDMFLIIHELVRKHSSKAEIVRLRNKWVTVDPRAWKARSDMTPAVGLGTGSKDQMLGHLQSLLGFQMTALQAGGLGGMVSPSNVYQTLKRMVENAGLKSADPFFSDPGSIPQQPPGPPPPDPRMVELQMRMQMEQQKEAAQLQMAREKMAAELQMAREKMAAQIQLDRDRMVLEADMARAKAQVDLATRGTLPAVRPGGELG